MEILKRGTPPAERTYDATCQHCGSVLRFQEREAKLHSDQRDGDYMTVDCPVCGRQVTRDMSSR